MISVGDRVEIIDDPSHYFSTIWPQLLGARGYVQRESSAYYSYRVVLDHPELWPLRPYVLASGAMLRPLDDDDNEATE